MKAEMFNVKQNADKVQRESTVMALRERKSTIRQFEMKEPETRARKPTIISKPIKINNKLFDPALLFMAEHKMTAEQKYDKGIVEHFVNEDKEMREKVKAFRERNMAENSEFLYDSIPEEPEK